MSPIISLQSLPIFPYSPTIPHNFWKFPHFPQSLQRSPIPFTNFLRNSPHSSAKFSLSLKKEIYFPKIPSPWYFIQFPFISTFFSKFPHRILLFFHDSSLISCNFSKFPSNSLQFSTISPYFPYSPSNRHYFYTIFHNLLLNTPLFFQNSFKFIPQFSIIPHNFHGSPHFYTIFLNYLTIPHNLYEFPIYSSTIPYTQITIIFTQFFTIYF